VTQVSGAIFGEDASDMGLSPTQWYNQQQLKTAIINTWINAGYPQDMAELLFDREMSPMLSQMFFSLTGTYLNNTLTFDSDGEITIFHPALMPTVAQADLSKDS